MRRTSRTSRTWRTFTGLACLAAVGLMTTACLVKDTTQTIYLEPDGTVTWTVLQTDVKSNGKTAKERAREETEFADAVRAEQQPVALAFGRLDPMSVRTDFLRSDRPYTVLTQARFARLDWLMERFFTKLGATATSTLDARDGAVTWTLTLSGLDDEASAHSADKDEAVEALFDSFEHCRFVLVAGHFTDAVGFELSSDNRVATLQFPHHKESDDTDSDALPHFSLTWTDVEK